MQLDLQQKATFWRVILQKPPECGFFSANLHELELYLAKQADLLYYKKDCRCIATGQNARGMYYGGILQ